MRQYILCRNTSFIEGNVVWMCLISTIQTFDYNLNILGMFFQPGKEDYSVILYHKMLTAEQCSIIATEYNRLTN